MKAGLSDSSIHDETVSYGTGECHIQTGVVGYTYFYLHDVLSSPQCDVGCDVPPLSAVAIASICELSSSMKESYVGAERMTIVAVDPCASNDIERENGGGGL